MTPEVSAALRRIVDELGADAGVLLRLTASGACVVTSSTLQPALGVDDIWSPPGSVGEADPRPELVLDTDRLVRLVPAGVLRALAADPSAALVAPLGDTMLRIILLWTLAPPQVDVASIMNSAAVRRFTVLAPLLDAQARAHESATRLRAVVGALDRAVVVTVAGDVLANVNAAAARLLGLPVGHVDGTTLATAMRALRERAVDPDALGVEVARLRQSRTATARDWVWHLHGSPSHLRVTSVPVDTTTEQGRVWVFDDISTEMELLESEQRANRALAESEERYRLLLENTAEVAFQSIEGVLTWVSPALEEVTGWTPESLLGGTAEHLWHPDDLDRAAAMRDGAMDGQPGHQVLRMHTPDGRYMSMEVVARPYAEPDGRRGLVGVMYDVSERVLAQEAARRSEERYRTVAENASDVVARYGPDGVIEWVFGSTEAFLGRSAAELVGTSLLEHFVEEDWGDLAAIRARLGSGGAVEVLSRLRKDDGSTRWVELRAKAALAPDGSISSIIGTMRDAQAEVEYREALAASERQARSLVDAYEAARDEAVRSSRAKTAFLSRMSHELRTPLNAVLGFAQLLALDALTPEQAEAVHHIRTGGRHLLDLINEIVDISRIEAGRLSLSMEGVGSTGVLAEAVELVGPLAQQHEVVVTVVGSGGAVADVHADRQRTTQVLLNLLSNAVKYNRPGGSVRVECRAGGPGEVAFEVTDTGPGIPQALLPRLFEPFDRLGAENSDVEGTGIGLALADALARAMGGRIEVSTQVGSGSTFTLVLRAAPSDAAVAGTVPRENDAHPDSRLRILYVEDNPTNATLMERVVALRPGSRLQVAVDGSHGIAAALLEPPDLVFLDLHLPDMPGEAVLEQLRLLPGLAEVPVVVVTADASPNTRERMAALGTDGFLTKPLDLDDVLGWIDATASGVGVA